MGSVPPELVEKYSSQPEVLGDRPRLNLTRSKAIFEEAKTCIPEGITGMRSPGFFIPGEYPIYFERGEGTHIWDVDGNEYIDFLASYGPTTIGFTEDEINAAVKERIDKGFSFSLPQPEQTYLAKKLQGMIPCAERTMFARTGTEACYISLRLARAYTGKMKVVTDGYHGWNDFSWMAPDAGIAPQIRALTIVAPWGDLAAYEAALKGGDVGCIMVTPFKHELMEPIIENRAFLGGLRELADRYGAVLVFDEVRTGFRVSLGGAQKYLGITPDIAPFSKAIANGYVLAAICAKAKIFDKVSPNGGPNGTYISSTFFLNSLEMVAALKTMEFYEKYDVIGDIWKKGEYFKAQIDKVIAKHRLPINNVGIPPMPSFLFDKEALGEERWVAHTFTLFTYLIRSGIFMHPYHQSYIAYRHTQADMDKALDALDRGLSVVEEVYA
jgi:glutamate-1-semialdehyde aminotransferase